ncbi:hypothetical protein [Helicobacter macacae]|uniref:hypothetical protein n=1 Tax=Helicobacter macacae TaxID=398626 RepID=UPI000412CE29|nr:hypothetical protein [Helicobacter macacae]
MDCHANAKAFARKTRQSRSFFSNDGNQPTPFIPLRRGRGNSQNYHLQREGELAKLLLAEGGIKKQIPLVLREGGNISRHCEQA